ncbi:MAG: hypothetical protein Kow00108_20570 [Calditrichia bacterium]
MKKLIIIPFMILIFIGQSFAQRGQFRNLYDVDNEKEMEGTIIKMETKKMNKLGRSEALILDVKTDEGVQKVMVGPEWYLNKQNIQLREKMKIKLIGSFANMDGEKMMLVREMMMENNKIQLRDKNGFPEWGGPKGVRGNRRMR